MSSLELAHSMVVPVLNRADTVGGGARSNAGWNVAGQAGRVVGGGLLALSVAESIYQIAQFDNKLEEGFAHVFELGGSVAGGLALGSVGLVAGPAGGIVLGIAGGAGGGGRSLVGLQGIRDAIPTMSGGGDGH